MKPKFDGDFATRDPSFLITCVTFATLATALVVLVCIPVMPIFAVHQFLEALILEAWSGVFQLLAIAAVVVVSILYILSLVLTGDWAQLGALLQALFDWLSAASLG